MVFVGEQHDDPATHRLELAILEGLAIVEFARMKGWHVMAGNVPRKYASQVARGGTSVLDQLPQAKRDLVAVDISAPKDDYFGRFAEAMSAHPVGTGGSKPELEEREMTERFYLAQMCQGRHHGGIDCPGIQQVYGTKTIDRSF